MCSVLHASINPVLVVMKICREMQSSVDQGELRLYLQNPADRMTFEKEAYCRVDSRCELLSNERESAIELVRTPIRIKG